MFDAVSGDLNQGEPVAVTLGLGESYLVGCDGECVRSLDAAFDLDVMDPTTGICGLDVVARVIACHLHGVPSKSLLCGKHCFNSAAFDFLGLAGEDSRFV